ncbi:MAG: EAL domain-containing protein, partial [Proteobacteria bacterium]|nr:EAL domain-containing protein [Pseudomonadota bacterium]
MEQVAALAGAGFQMAIDDFGTGYSNIAQLGRLPADWLKIDRSLLVAAERSETDRAVLAAVASFGLVLGKTLVVEGIETEAQAALATELGCQVGQGYLFAKPMPAETFMGWWQAYRETGVR